MATETRHSGTLRTDYESDRARLDDLRPLTADTDILLHRLTEASRKMPYRDADGREGILTPLLENHVLTVLADIRRKRLTGYGSTFADAQGTAAQARYVEKPHDFDPFGQTGFAHLWLQYDCPFKVLVLGVNFILPLPVGGINWGMKTYKRGYLRARAEISADKDGDIFGQKRRYLPAKPHKGLTDKVHIVVIIPPTGLPF